MKIRDELEKAAMPIEAKPSQTADKHCRSAPPQTAASVGLLAIEQIALR
jgi:hypothetical protein